MRLVYALFVLCAIVQTIHPTPQEQIQNTLKERHAQVSVIKPTAQGKLFFKKLHTYITSGEYEREIESALKPAYACLEAALKNYTTGNAPLALVLDVDETALSNWPSIQQFQGWDTPKTHRLSLIHYIENVRPCATAPALQPVRAFYNAAKARGVSIFFITGRPMAQHRYTKAMLSAAGYADWAGIFDKTPQEQSTENAHFKPAMRKAITDAGYHIIMNIGDQVSDLSGGYADCTIKLPNPFYEVA